MALKTWHVAFFKVIYSLQFVNALSLFPFKAFADDSAV